MGHRKPAEDWCLAGNKLCSSPLMPEGRGEEIFHPSEIGDCFGPLGLNSISGLMS